MTNKSKKEQLDDIFRDFEKNEAKRIDDLKKLNPKIIYDGYVSTQEQFDKSERILFIASEANDLNGNGMRAFWVKHVINDEPFVENKTDRFIKNINRLHKALLMYIYDRKEPDFIINKLKDDAEWTTNYEELKNIAYMNLKKTGGMGEVNAPETIKKDGIDFIGWINAHKELISKQIEIIDPRIIVVMGNKYTQPAFKLVTEKYPLSSEALIFYAYHPKPRKSNEQFLRHFFEFNKTSFEKLCWI